MLSFSTNDGELGLLRYLKVHFSFIHYISDVNVLFLEIGEESTDNDMIGGVRR